mmetsp:Transcript_10826/g.35569  ORF Transcript_10826/g.35569 Transcript_10826/m.35569 type:complete len:480 (-) Transcript_10826:147-1586(-)
MRMSPFISLRWRWKEVRSIETLERVVDDTTENESAYTSDRTCSEMMLMLLTVSMLAVPAMFWSSHSVGAPLGFVALQLQVGAHGRLGNGAAAVAAVEEGERRLRLRRLWRARGAGARRGWVSRLRGRATLALALALAARGLRVAAAGEQCSSGAAGAGVLGSGGDGGEKYILFFRRFRVRRGRLRRTHTTTSLHRSIAGVSSGQLFSPLAEVALRGGARRDEVGDARDGVTGRLLPSARPRPPKGAHRFPLLRSAFPSGGARGGARAGVHVGSVRRPRPLVRHAEAPVAAELPGHRELRHLGRVRRVRAVHDERDPPIGHRPRCQRRHRPRGVVEIDKRHRRRSPHAEPRQQLPSERLLLRRQARRLRCHGGDELLRRALPLLARAHVRDRPSARARRRRSVLPASTGGAEVVDHRRLQVPQLHVRGCHLDDHLLLRIHLNAQHRRVVRRLLIVVADGDEGKVGGESHSPCCSSKSQRK